MGLGRNSTGAAPLMASLGQENLHSLFAANMCVRRERERLTSCQIKEENPNFS